MPKVSMTITYVCAQLVPPPITPDQEDPIDQQIYESVVFQASHGSDIGENGETSTKVGPVSDSTGTGTEAKARLSATVASEAYGTNGLSKSNGTFGESSVVEEDIAYYYHTPIVDNDGKL